MEKIEVKCEKYFCADEMIDPIIKISFIKAIAYSNSSFENKRFQMLSWIVGLGLGVPFFLLQEYIENATGIPSKIQYLLFLIILFVIINIFNAIIEKKTKNIGLSDIIVSDGNNIYLFNQITVNIKHKTITAKNIYTFTNSELKKTFIFSSLADWIPDVTSVAAIIKSGVITLVKKAVDKNFKIKLKITNKSSLILEESKIQNISSYFQNQRIHEKAVTLKYFAKSYLS